MTRYLSRGARWFSFYERGRVKTRPAIWEGHVVPRNYVYLGDEPITAVLTGAT